MRTGHSFGFSGQAEWLSPSSPSFGFGEMSTSYIVSRHGLKCNKVRRVSDPEFVPTATASVVSSPSTQSASSTFLRVYSTPASKRLAKLPSSFEPATSNLAHPGPPLLTADTRSTEAGPAGVLSKRFVDKAEPYTPLSTIQSVPSVPSHRASSLAGIQTSDTPTSGSYLGLSTTPTAEGTRLSPRTSSENTDHHNDLPSTIAGTILGVLGFVAFTALIVVLLLRRRRRLYGDIRSISSNGKLSRMSRNSTPTLTSWYPRHHSSVSSRAGTQTPQSLLGHTRHASEPLATPKSVMFHNPFSKSAELCTAPPADPSSTSRDPFSDPEADNRIPRPTKLGSQDLQTIQEKPEGLPSKPERIFIPRSLYSSDRSIGSTIVLPGRNSSVGSLQVLSYRLSSPLRLSASIRMPSPGALSPRPVDPAARRPSTRSDPFDLEVPTGAEHPRPQPQQ